MRRSPALVFSAAIHFAMKCSAPCSAVLRHSPSSWAAVVHWSALMPKALRSSRKHSIHSFSWPDGAGAHDGVGDGPTGEGDGAGAHDRVGDGSIGEGDGAGAHDGVGDGPTEEGDGAGAHDGVDDGPTGEGDGAGAHDGVGDGPTGEGDGAGAHDGVGDGPTGEGDGAGAHDGVGDGPIGEGDGAGAHDGGPRSPRPPPFLRTSRTSAVSYPPCAPQIPQTRSAFCVKWPRCSHFPS